MLAEAPRKRLSGWIGKSFILEGGSGDEGRGGKSMIGVLEETLATGARVLGRLRGGEPLAASRGGLEDIVVRELLCDG
jgi:hypothetical protein